MSTSAQPDPNERPEELTEAEAEAKLVYLFDDSQGVAMPDGSVAAPGYGPACSRERLTIPINSPAEYFNNWLGFQLPVHLPELEKGGRIEHRRIWLPLSEGWWVTLRYEKVALSFGYIDRLVGILVKLDEEPSADPRHFLRRLSDEEQAFLYRHPECIFPYEGTPTNGPIYVTMMQFLIMSPSPQRTEVGVICHPRLREWLTGPLNAIRGRWSEAAPAIDRYLGREAGEVETTQGDQQSSGASVQRKYGAHGSTMDRVREARQLIEDGEFRTKACKRVGIDSRTYDRYVMKVTCPEEDDEE